MTQDTERANTHTTVSIYEVFTELDGYLASDDDYCYDVETGLQQQQRTIDQLTTADTEQAQTSARLRDDDTAAVGEKAAGASATNAMPLREIVAGRMNDLIIGPLRIASAISREVAIRLADGIRGQRWALNWLLGRVLTRQQAFSGMVLDEILTDPHELDSATVMLVMAEGTVNTTALSHFRLCPIFGGDPRSVTARCAGGSCECLCGRGVFG
ncbi:hypothetical protein ACFZC5_36075, partial [Nocardia gamkensis]